MVEIAELSFVAISISLLIVIFLLRRHFAMTPSNDRSWVNDNQRLASVEITGDKAHIKNVRTSVGEPLKIMMKDGLI